MPTINYKLKNGTPVKGVTTILNNLGWNKTPLMWWAWDQGKQGLDFRATTDQAAEAGTLCHLMIENTFKGRGPKPQEADYPATVWKWAVRGFSSFQDWWDLHQIQPRSVEPNLVSEVYGFGGTPDLIAEVGGKLSLVDWKTSKGVYPEMLIQLAAYKVLWEENHPDQPIEGGFHLLKISKKRASFTHHYWEDLSECWLAFRAALALEEARNIIKEMV